MKAKYLLHIVWLVTQNNFWKGLRRLFQCISSSVLINKGFSKVKAQYFIHICLIGGTKHLSKRLETEQILGTSDTWQVLPFTVNNILPFICLVCVTWNTVQRLFVPDKFKCFERIEWCTLSKGCLRWCLTLHWGVASELFECGPRSLVHSVMESMLSIYFQCRARLFMEQISKV